jgi:hypothetical protein
MLCHWRSKTQAKRWSQPHKAAGGRRRLGMREQSRAIGFQKSSRPTEARDRKTYCSPKQHVRARMVTAAVSKINSRGSRGSEQKNVGGMQFTDSTIRAKDIW